ncbi:MAG: DUF4153 domain-containing protein [Caulobacter sp.]|nr:DUF4153 domain-containing protein [Caulobacter sp.]
MAYATEDRAVSREIGLARIAIGLAQGVALWGLTEAADNKVWPATQGLLFGLLAMLVLLVPFVLLGGLAEMRRRPLIIWTVVAAAVLAVLGAHDIGRLAVGKAIDWVSARTMIFSAVGLFIAHHLVAAADADRRVIARFPTYFDLAWKHGVQMAMAVGFVGVFWIVLTLGGALFKVIGIDFVETLIRKSWFAIPASTTMFAAAVQLTDVRHGLIRGIRTVALTLLSWLLPVLVFLTAAFMAALPFTGLDPLWKTRSAAAILLSAAAVMIVLINAAYQDGEPDTPTPVVLRWAARVGGLLMLPLVGVAAFALWLRISQYGLTPDRIVASAFVIAGICYAVGYALAAVLPGAWMKRLELTNIATSFVVLALLIALFTPIADPARLSVNDQMARLAAGKIKPEAFDYRFLRFESERYGVAALGALKTGGGEAGKRAAETLAVRHIGDMPPSPRPDRDPVYIDALPAGTVLPAGFLAVQDRGEFDGPSACTDKARPCVARMVDLDGDGTDEVVVDMGWSMTVWAPGTEGRWRQVGRFDDVCDREATTLRDGKVETVAPQWRDLSVDGRRLNFRPDNEACPGPVPAPPAKR